jgi:parallel beta-helix repeat protein
MNMRSGSKEATILLGLLLIKPVHADTVANSAELSTALRNATPGETIELIAGTYQGRFVATTNGNAKKPITLLGPRSAVLTTGGTSIGYALHLNNVSNWRVSGISIQNSKKGIVLDRSRKCDIDNVLISNIGEEGVHFRGFSSDNTLRNSTISNTGRVNPGVGEAVYIGSAQSQWNTYSDGKPDSSDSNKILNNHLGPDVPAECIDGKEGTVGGQIVGNTFEDCGISGLNSADSWLELRGNSYLVNSNVGMNSSGSALLDGVQVRPTAGWGNNNSFRANNFEVNAPGYGFRILSGTTGNVVYSDNTVTGAELGVANVPLQ